jgi:hypothetical protein
MTEIWKPIKGYENLYMISSNGRVKSLGRYSIRKDGKPCHYPSKMMSLCHSTKGYLIVGLTKNGKCTTYFVHRLVADAFIPNPEGLPQVNHINEDKTDNRACNLEWMSCADNVNHGTGKVRCGKAHEYPVVMTMPDGSETEFSSATAAANALGIVSQGIQHCCAGRMQSYKGCRWRYRDRHRARIEVKND